MTEQVMPTTDARAVDARQPACSTTSLRAFDRAGRLAKRVARRRKGPGELGSMGPLYRLADSVFAFDFSSRRVTVFGSPPRVEQLRVSRGPLHPPDGLHRGPGKAAG